MMLYIRCPGYPKFVALVGSPAITCCIYPRAHSQQMATIGTTTMVVAARPAIRVLGLPQLRVKMSERLRCSFSKDSKNAPSDPMLPPAVLKGMGLRRSWRPWGKELVDEQMSMECTPIRLLSMALNPEWIMWCVVCLMFVRPLRRRNDDHKSRSAGLPQLKVKITERLRCGFSNDGKKAPSALTLSPAVLKGMGLRRSWRPWGTVLVDDDEQMSTECTTLRLLSMALNPGWILWFVVCLIFVHPPRQRNDDHKSAGRTR